MTPTDGPSRDRDRQAMIRDQLIARGVNDPRVLAAIAATPRERFVPPDQAASAYDDRALPIGADQTISQPYIVGLMTQMLDIQPTDSVLEIGAGSGYQTAILARLARTVHAVERIGTLADQARRRLADLGLTNIHLHLGDGTLGPATPPAATPATPAATPAWTLAGPFDRILVAAAAPEIPQSLIDQLADPGRLIIPIGGLDLQTLTLLDRRRGRLQRRPILDVRFVKLLGRHAWPCP